MSEGFGGSGIQLENPVAEHFPSFIVGNAAEYEKRFPPKNPRNIFVPTEDGMEMKLPFCEKVVKEGSGAGQTVVICGAGPSLRDEAAEWCPKGDQVWGCNSALTWLHDNGHKVTHGFTVDQTPHMLAEWNTAPENVEYLLASTVHSHLTDMLLSRGREIRFFHNFVGVKLPPVDWPDTNGVMRTDAWEDWAYQLMYEGTIRAGSGLNAVTRAIDVALYMGFEKIIVLGADCCLRFNSPPPDAGPGDPEFDNWLRRETVMHADGGNALASEATPMVLVGEIDGRTFAVKPDLVITAVWLVVMRRALKNRLQIIGDGLPNALKNKSNRFLERLPHLVDAEGRSVLVAIKEHDFIMPNEKTGLVGENSYSE